MFNEPTDPYEDADREDDEFCDGRGRFDHDENGQVVDKIKTMQIYYVKP